MRKSKLPYPVQYTYEQYVALPEILEFDRLLGCYRSLQCTSSKLFDFLWTLFISVKSDFPEISDDLVNSYHLLLACCDLIYANVVMADRTDLLNNKFPGKLTNIIKYPSLHKYTF